MVRASYGMFYDHPLLGLYFLGDASDGSSSGQLAFAGTGSVQRRRQSRKSERDPDLPGTSDQPAESAPNPCAATLNPAAAAALGYSAQPAAVSGPEFSRNPNFSQPELSEPVDVSCRWAFSRSAIRRRRTSSTPTRSRRTSPSSATSAAASRSAWPTTSTADAI